AFIRNRDFFKIVSVLETGADHGMWTFDRYRTWLERRGNWHIPGRETEGGDSEAVETVRPAAVEQPRTAKAAGAPTAEPATPPGSVAKPAPPAGGRIEIEPETPFGKILKR